MGVHLVSVIVHHGSGTAKVEQALKTLKRKIQKDAVIRELKASIYYERPSIRKRKKREEAMKKRSKVRKRMNAGVSYKNFIPITGDEHQGNAGTTDEDKKEQQ